MDELKPCPFCGGKVSLTDVSFCLELMQFKCADCGTIFRMKDYIWNHRVFPPEVQQAVERMKPKKPKKPPIEEAPIGRNFYRICPSCGHEIGYLDIYDFCRVCGQALDWSE